MQSDNRPDVIATGFFTSDPANACKHKILNLSSPMLTYANTFTIRLKETSKFTSSFIRGALETKPELEEYGAPWLIGFGNIRCLSHLKESDSCTTPGRRLLTCILLIPSSIKCPCGSIAGICEGNLLRRGGSLEL